MEIGAKEVVKLNKVIEGLKEKEKFSGLINMRIPVCNSAVPLETDFDIFIKTLIETNTINLAIINDQEFQTSASFEGLAETILGANFDLLNMYRHKMDPNKNALQRGEFEVIKELVAKLKDEGAKNECDKVTDKNGAAKTKGIGDKLRENIAESKLSYEIMNDAAQVFFKPKIMDNTHMHFHLIVFTAFMHQAAELARSAVSLDV